jgi:glycosyltransferase involved in cell wall biosynthesis
MHILLWGTYDTGKPRVRILREGLRKKGFTVEEIHTAVWAGVEDKSQLRGFVPRLGRAMRWAAAYPGLLFRLLRARKPDLILVGYPGLIDVFFASIIGRIRRIPVVWDVFLSIYDTLVIDRQLMRENSIGARLLYRLERLALRLPSLAFMDTRAHARRIESLFKLSADMIGSVWVGVESEWFTPEPKRVSGANAPLRILFYGQFIPLHGIPVIVEAARKLRSAAIEWTFIGRGQEEPKIQRMLDQDPLPKVRWIKWVEYTDLHTWMSESDLCLGIFGSSAKAASVIPNKVFQILAMGRPLITRDSEAMRELVEPSPPQVWLVPPGDPAALAMAVEQFQALKCQLRPNGKRIEVDAIAVASQFAELLKQRMGLE